MWCSASKIVAKASSNPQVQTVGAVVVGALLWKGSDVYEKHKQKGFSDFRS